SPSRWREKRNCPFQYLRLLAPPLQLLSAAVWQVVQQGLVDHYGILEEFVTMVTELVPELMSYSQKAQLIMGLRARLVLEMCRGEHPVDMQDIQPHLDRLKAPVSTAKDHHVEESEVNFVELVHSLLENPTQRTYFFQEIFPAYFGSKYDASLEMLVWEFISRLDELLPVPDFTQLTALLGDAPTLLADCLRSSFQPGDLKAVLEHHRELGHFKEKAMDDCILSSLSLPPGAKPAVDSASSPHLTDSDSSELRGQ
uniref:TERF1-interacting nuclear factor 2 N-terminal domain-containing protein n=1 Tax=Tetraodon nigroviridis TaxID=99883 RepID=H3DMG5_TETNG